MTTTVDTKPDSLAALGALCGVLAGLTTEAEVRSFYVAVLAQAAEDVPPAQFAAWVQAAARKATRTGAAS